MRRIRMCLLLGLLALSVIHVVDCTIESEVIEELPEHARDFPSPELPEGISEPIKLEFDKPFRSQGRFYPCSG